MLNEGPRLDHTVDNSAAVHFGPNCGTFTRVRERPIPGVKHPPIPLRSLEKPEGLPFLKAPKWQKIRKRVDNDTYMAKMSGRKALQLHKSGRLFSLEHPGNSIANELEEWKELKSTPGVFQVFHHHCMFWPCKKRKYQVLYTNVKSLQAGLGRLCQSPKVCSRTGQPHDSFQSKVVP